MRLSRPELVLAYFLLSTTLTAGDQFNIFKSYGNAAKKPRQYATQRSNHAITEYLDPIQLKMMKYRKSPDDPRVMFNDKTWSGFDKKQNVNRGEMNRRLTDSHSHPQIRRIGAAVEQAADEVTIDEHDPSFLLFSVILMAIFGIILFVGYGRIRRIKHPSSRHQQQQQQQQQQQTRTEVADIDLEAAAVGTLTSAAVAFSV